MARKSEEKKLSTQKSGKKKSLSKRERSAKDFINVAFSEHKEDSEWYCTSGRLLDAYKGKYFKKSENRDRFIVNTVYSLVNLVMPNLIFQQPHIPVRAKNARYLTAKTDMLDEILGRNLLRAARNMEAVINDHYQKIEAITEDQKAVQDALFFSFGITKDGYSFDTISKEDKDYILKDTPFHRRVDPRNFGWHPMASGVDDSPKLDERLIMLKSELKKTLKSLGESTADLDRINSEMPQFIKDKFKCNADMTTHLKSVMDEYIVVHEVHDQENGEILIYGGSEDPILLHKKSDPYDFNGSHFNMIKFAGAVGDFLGIAPLSTIEDEAIALNEVLTLIVSHYRRFPGQVFIEKGLMDEDDMDRFESGELGSIHEVNDISKIIKTSPLVMGQEYFSIVNLMNQMIDRVLGISDFQRVQGGRRSASEATFIEGNATVRRNYMLKFVKDFVLSGIRKQAALKQQFMDKKEVIQASGELQYEIFEVGKEDIEGEFMFDFDVDNMTAVNETQFNNINNMLQVLAGNETLQPITRQLDPYKTGRILFRKAGLIFEDFVTDYDAEVIYLSPEKENDIALKGKGDELSAKRGEPHKKHEEQHREAIEERIRQVGPMAAQQDPIILRLIDHLADHKMKESEELGVKQASPPEKMQTAPVGPQGPQGPLQGVPGV